MLGKQTIGGRLSTALSVVLTPVAFAAYICFGLFPAYQYCMSLQLALTTHGIKTKFEGRGFLLSALSHFLFIPLGIATCSIFPNTTLGLSFAGGVAALLHAIVLAPFSLFVPAHLDLGRTRTRPDRSSRREHILPSLESALTQWDAVRPRERMTLVLFRAVPVMATVAIMLGLSDFGYRGWAMLVGPWVYGIGLMAYLGRLGQVYARTRLQESEAPPPPKGVLALAGVAIVLALVVCGYGALAATQPTPMERVDAPPANMAIPAREALAIARTGALPPGTAPVAGTQVSIRWTGDGVIVETPDGGGAGEVRYVSTFERPPRDEPRGAQQPPEPRTPEILPVVNSNGTSNVYVDDGNRWWRFSINEYGVRTDDGVVARLEQGLGDSAPITFLIGALLMALAVWLLARGVRRARRLHAIADVEELQAADRVGAMDGTLQGESLFVRDGRLFGDGHIQVQLKGGLARLRLPDEGVECIGKTAENEQAVTLLGTFPRVTHGHRESTLPWPGEAQLVLGDKDKVADRMLRDAMRPARVALFLAGAAELTALVMVWLHRG